MAATNVYLIHLYYALEFAGLQIAIVNKVHVKRMDGRKMILHL